MEKEPKLENKDFREAGLSIVEPQMDKNFMISFEAEDENQNKVYNRAIQEICEEQKLNPFHQVGSNTKTGYQAWEMWAEVDEETLERLIPEIHKKAKEIYEKYKELGFIE